jgi:enamine deaminase RidA (YjgF/YER057c/UK114 family)
MRKYLGVLCIAMALSPVAMAADAASQTIIIPEKADRAYDEYHYAPAVRVGDMVILSGIPAGGPGTYSDQVRRMFQRVEATLKLAGATMDDVVELNTFHANAKTTEEFGTEFQSFLVVHKEFFKNHYPAWTAVGTTALLAKGSPVEMRVVAMIGSGKSVIVQRESATKR